MMSVGFNRGLVFAALLASATGLAPAPASAMDAETAQKFSQFATSAGYLGFLQQRLPQLEPTLLRATCADIRPLQRKRLTMVVPPVFEGDAKQPSSGAWVDQVTTSRCGTEVLRSMLISVKDNNLQLAALLPGSTEATPPLQRDAAPLAESRARQVANCASQMQVVDTRAEGDVKPGAAWNEVWTLQGCDNAKVDIAVTFTPDGKGNTLVSVAPK